MSDNPRTLKDLCIDCVSENIDHLWKVEQKDFTDLNVAQCPESEYNVFINNNVYLPMELSEILLKKLSSCYKLNDDIMSLFSNKNVYLRNVTLPNTQKLTIKGLRTLKTHKIEKLFTYGLDCTVSNLLGSLSIWTIENLHSLCLANSLLFTHANDKGSDMNDLFSKLKNLRLLDISYTTLSTDHLTDIAKKLPHLKSLDISNTNVSTFLPLQVMKTHLQKLRAYNLKVIYNNMNPDAALSPLKYMSSLTHLDVSYTKYSYNESINSDSPWIKYLTDPDWLPNLVALDISGNGNFGLSVMQEFLTSHKKLKFLGLMHMTDCELNIFTLPTDPFYNPDLVVSGTITEEQIFTGLKLYTFRPNYIQKCFHYLSKWIKTYNSPRVDIIQIILNAMNSFPGHCALQLTATYCLYHLTRQKLSLKLHPSILARVIKATLNANEHFPKHMHIQKNTLLIICNDHIIKDIKMDKFKCAKLVLEALCFFNGEFLNKLCLIICSILIAKLSPSDTSLLGSNVRYMSRLLYLVEQKLNDRIFDEILKLALCTLWNLTDDSYRSCKVFIDEGGVELCMKILAVFVDNTIVEISVLGLLNNIVKISDFRHKLLCVNILPTVRCLLHSEHIDISYLAAGIISFLSFEPGWEIYNVIDRVMILEELRHAVRHWVHPEKEMMKYKSFKPFINLLNSNDKPQVQLWAAWAIYHVCTINAETYFEIFNRENIGTILQRIILNKSVDCEVCEVYSHILQIMEKYKNDSFRAQPL